MYIRSLVVNPNENIESVVYNPADHLYLRAIISPDPLGKSTLHFPPLSNSLLDLTQTSFVAHVAAGVSQGNSNATYNLHYSQSNANLLVWRRPRSTNDLPLFKLENLPDDGNKINNSNSEAILAGILGNPISSLSAEKFHVFATIFSLLCNEAFRKGTLQLVADYLSFRSSAGENEEAQPDARFQPAFAMMISRDFIPLVSSQPEDVQQIQERLKLLLPQ
jgi:hypothetical protein